MPARLALFLLALGAAACSEYDDSQFAGNDGPARDPDREGGGADVASEDAPAATDITAGDRAMEGGTTIARDAALDAVRDDPSPDHAADAAFDAAPSDAPGDGAPGDVSGADASSSDALSDATGDPTAPRFFRTGQYSIVIPASGDAGVSGDAASGDPADVYYPDPPDLRTGSYTFPVVLLLQGAKVARGFYGGVAAGVARYGFIVVVPDHTSNNIGGPGLYAELGEIAAASAQMKIEALSATAPVRGVVDTTRIALMGHSYGGASGLSGMANACFPPIPLCTFTRPPDLVAGAFYGTNLATPILGVPALDTGGLPVLVVQGDRDGKALPADAQKTYDQIQKRPKAIISLIGANHYGVTDVDNPTGADPEVNAQTLDHAEGVASTARWIGVFFAAFLHGDTAARGALRAAGSFDPHVAIVLAE